MTMSKERLAEIKEMFADFRQRCGRPDRLNCCSAHPVADTVPELILDFEEIHAQAVASEDGRRRAEAAHEQAGAVADHLADTARRVTEQARAEVERLDAELTEYRQANTRMQQINVWRADERDRALDKQRYAEAERDRLAERVRQMEKLTHDTDGNLLEPDSELPVGVFYGALYGEVDGR